MHSTGRLPSDSHVRVSYQDNPDQVKERFFASLCGILLAIVSVSFHNWIEVRIKATIGNLSSLFLI